MFGDEDAGSEGGGGCETTVVRKLLPPTELKTSSLETRCAETEVNSVVSFTETSKMLGEVDLTRMVYVLEASSVCRMTRRS